MIQTLLEPTWSTLYQSWYIVVGADSNESNVIENGQ